MRDHQTTNMQPPTSASLRAKVAGRVTASNQDRFDENQPAPLDTTDPG
ncbi:MAG: hypothetical protein QOE22_244 [Candidatus Parcubacteria bacterium]|jgi:hypothetical protein|nr:hypothetical protein [Candidatus Parcubacteria bacterium]